MAKASLPAGIRPRGSKFFVDVTINGQRKTATCKTLEEAVQKQADLRNAITVGKPVVERRSNARTWTLQQALDKTLSLPKPEGWRGISYEKQATLNAQSALDFMGPDRMLDTIDRALIDAWLTSLEHIGNSDSTINRKKSALTKIMKVALAYGGVDKLPQFPKQRIEPVGRIRQITQEEEQQLLQNFTALGMARIRDFVTVLIDTGMRCGELRNLRPSDLDFKNGVLMIYGTEGKGTKNGTVRSVPMTKRVRAILRERKVGVTCFDITKDELRQGWDRVRAMMGLMGDPQFVPHVCRHTCCSRLVQNGVFLPVVQKWMGHKDIKTTMGYAHLFPQDLMAAVEALEK